MPYHAIDPETQTSYYSFLYDWSSWQSITKQDRDLAKRLISSCCGAPVRARRNRHFFSFSLKSRSPIYANPLCVLREPQL